MKLVNVAMRTAEAFYNIFMYFYNKNILEYGQIARNGTESMIPDTEGRSNSAVILSMSNLHIRAVIFSLPNLYYVQWCNSQSGLSKSLIFTLAYQANV